jgi:outer membrane murein-binding lipoprotein Lpp
LSVDTASGNIGVTEGGTQIYSGSDQRLKTNVQDLPSQLDKINQLRPVSFDWKYTAEEENVYGFIAQEVQVVDETVVYNMGETMYRVDKQYGEDLPADGTIQDTLAIHERQLIPMLVKAMQEMSAKIDTLQSQINTLQNK